MTSGGESKDRFVFYLAVKQHIILKVMEYLKIYQGLTSVHVVANRMMSLILVGWKYFMMDGLN